jgi:hypothetical protein
MIDQCDDIALARSLKRQRVALVNPLIGEIADALLVSGGAAHRDVVIDLIAVGRGAPSASDGLRRELIEAFDLHCDYTDRGGLPAVLHLPFGPHSRRWALTHDALDLLQYERRSQVG